jgi:hypothetical protein
VFAQACEMVGSLPNPPMIRTDGFSAPSAMSEDSTIAFKQYTNCERGSRSPRNKILCGKGVTKSAQHRRVEVVCQAILCRGRSLPKRVKPDSQERAGDELGASLAGGIKPKTPPE